MPNIKELPACPVETTLMLIGDKTLALPAASNFDFKLSGIIKA